MLYQCYFELFKLVGGFNRDYSEQVIILLNISVLGSTQALDYPVQVILLLNISVLDSTQAPGSKLVNEVQVYDG